MSNPLSCDKCLTMELINKHINGTDLDKFTTEELGKFPLDYLIKGVSPENLLSAWSKLPYEYQQDFNLQIRLPCYVHHNRPEWRGHIDGPPSSQGKCEVCQWGLEKCTYYRV